MATSHIQMVGIEPAMTFEEVAESIFLEEMALYEAGKLSKQPRKLSRQRIHQCEVSALKKLANSGLAHRIKHALEEEPSPCDPFASGQGSNWAWKPQGHTPAPRPRYSMSDRIDFSKK